MAVNPYDRRQRGGGGGRGRNEPNPFEMMNSQMTQMQNMMDSAFGGPPGSMMRGGMMGGGMMDSMMGGGMMGGMGGMGGMGSMMGSMGGGGGGGSSYSSSCCCYSSSSSGNGGQPQVVQYSSSSHGMQRAGEEMVQETHRNYKDSSGQERLGVSRRIGDRGRSVVAERRADGTEQRTDSLIGVNDGTSFDHEWRGNRAATQINNQRTQMQALTQADPFGGGGMGFGHALGHHGGGRTHAALPQQSSADREAARGAQRQYEQDRQRIIDEARKQREGAAPAQIGYNSRGGGRQPSHRGSGGDHALASRMAQEEARRAGMY